MIAKTKKRLRESRRIWQWMPVAFFGALLVARSRFPETLAFDEVHYVPAAKALIQRTANLNVEHPPLAKLILGLGWLLLTKLLHVFSEPWSFRITSGAFGLLGLLAIRRWMRELKLSERAAQAAVWLSGLGFLWFVVSRTAMLDSFYVAFGLWGTLFIAQGKWARGWVVLGFALCSKWLAVPFIAIGALIHLLKVPARSTVLVGFALAATAYFVPFLWLVGIKQGGLAHLGDVFQVQSQMLHLLNSSTHDPHPYASHWWQWVLLLKPTWFFFEQNGGDRSVWAGGNPVLFAVGLPALGFVFWSALKNQAARIIALFYGAFMLFFAASPKSHDQYFYYYLVPSLWLGPAVAWTHEKLIGPKKYGGWVLFGFVLLCAASFIYFLPIMDGRLLTPGRYHRYLWLDSWLQ